MGKAMDEEKLQFLNKRVLRYLQTHPEGVSGKQITGWLWSIQKVPVTLQDVEHVLYHLRDAGQIAVANTLWFKRASL
jgi:hypothetical protein